MINSSDQMIRYWIDTILQLTRDGLKKPILIAYKNRFPKSYMTEIQEKLRNLHGLYPPDIFTSDDLLLAKLDDPKAWLDLMSRRWNDLFLQKSGSTGKRHVETLKEIRDKWAHSRPLTVQDAYSAAVTAINLLKDFQCDQAVQEIRAIFSELDKAQYVDSASPQASVVVSPPPDGGESLPAAMPTTSIEQASSPDDNQSSKKTLELPVTNVHTVDADANTDLVQTYPDGYDYYIEVVGCDGRAYDWKIPASVDRIVIGRSHSSNLNVADPKVSRVHLLVAHNGHGLMLTDLRSANGTYVDGKPLTPNLPTHWQPGQTVMVGSTLLILRRG